MATTIRPGVRGTSALWATAAHWGLWPTVVMVLSQMTAAKLLGIPYPATVMHVTIAGTLAMYGLDRLVERQSLPNLAERHKLHGPLDILMMVVIVAVAVPGVLKLSQHDLIWLITLGMLGLCYLLITTGRLPHPPFGKEIMGALCYTLLTWGWALHPTVILMVGHFFLGLSNFLWSSRLDRERDQANQLPNQAVGHPTRQEWLARGSALVAIGILILTPEFGSLFLFTAVGLLFFSVRFRWVDLTFLPLIAILWLLT